MDEELKIANEQYRDEIINGWQNQVFCKNRLRKIFVKQKDSNFAVFNDTMDELFIVIGNSRESFLNDVAEVVMRFLR